MSDEKEAKFKELVETYRRTGKFSDKIKMHTYAINECKMYMTKPMTEEELLGEVIKLENEIETLRAKALGLDQSNMRG